LPGWAARRARVVARAATQTGEEALAILRQRVAAGGAGSHFLKSSGVITTTSADHLRVVGAAVLRAEQVIGAGLVASNQTVV